MIQVFAQVCRSSAFVAVFVYALIFSAVHASFAQAAFVDRALNGGVTICTTGGLVDSAKDAAPVHCQLCCLVELDAFKPHEAGVLIRLIGKSDPIFLVRDARSQDPTIRHSNPRGPPLS